MRDGVHWWIGDGYEVWRRESLVKNPRGGTLQSITFCPLSYDLHCIYPDIHTCLHACILTYLLTYIHTPIHDLGQLLQAHSQTEIVCVTREKEEGRGRRRQPPYGTSLYCTALYWTLSLALLSFFALDSTWGRETWKGKEITPKYFCGPVVLISACIAPTQTPTAALLPKEKPPQSPFSLLGCCETHKTPAQGAFHRSLILTTTSRAYQAVVPFPS